MPGSSLLDKLWESHVVDRSPDKPDLLYIDRHLVHEVTSHQAFEELRKAGRPVRRPDLTCAVIDHSIPTDDRTRPLKDPVAEAQLAALEKNQADFGLTVFFRDPDERQGVIHVTMPEQGLILPGHSVVCGDSHTATHGALGALAFGIGTSEVGHVLASQTLSQYKPKSLSVRVDGKLHSSVTAKDLILYIINTLGVAGGTGHALEYRGSAVEALSLEGRLTLANMAIECGARLGLIAPDQTAFDYLEGRPYAPKGEDFKAAVRVWKKLASDPGCEFDKSVIIDAGQVSARVTWGTNPAQNIALDSSVPDPALLETADERAAGANALAYQGLKPGTPLADVPVDYVFIGSCTNGRLEDLIQAAEVFRDHKVKKGVQVLVVPGSGVVRRQAEEMGLAEIFLKAGCQWRRPGCSMCLAMNPDLVPSGARCVSTSNRNFEGRQGRGALTHLASPLTAAASAAAGRIVGPASL
ncbi:MAG: 3-isopropylmalate dehydratase large subunit [Deltaproteobacteria bacterium]|jgi:3-isopropylmalate/(R)-2-methylmalate dehydratase large subunit|nr:3-isopropylmalate dehydratase large subunit [Deltaproteobacteria bacterium]